jgi:hypothetical protein
MLAILRHIPSWCRAYDFRMWEIQGLFLVSWGTNKVVAEQTLQSLCLDSNMPDASNNNTNLCPETTKYMHLFGIQSNKDMYGNV